MAKLIDDAGLGHAGVVLDSTEQFSSLNNSAAADFLRATKELTFHIWANKDSFFHTHENYLEIFIVTSGKLLHRFNDQTSVMRKGDAFLIFPGQYHQHIQYKDYPSQHINLTCSLPFAHSLCKIFFGTENLKFPCQHIHLTDNEFAVVKNMQNVILRSQTTEHLFAALRTMLSLLFGFFYFPKQGQAFDETLPKWLLEFIQELQNLDFSDPVHLSDLYAISGYSQSTLSIQFKKYMGQTLVSYINDLKLKSACNQLKNTNFSLSEIAQASGFESYPYFSRLFKRTFGMTPQQYRSS